MVIDPEGEYDSFFVSSLETEVSRICKRGRFLTSRKVIDKSKLPDNMDSYNMAVVVNSYELAGYKLSRRFTKVLERERHRQECSMGVQFLYSAAALIRGGNLGYIAHPRLKLHPKPPMKKAS
jgi:hypothetical protein